VEFSSYCLELAVRDALDQPGGTITYGDLKQVERLALLGNEVLEDPSSYTYYMGDTTGDTSYGDVSDLSLLASMPNLTEVWLCRQQITDLSPLEGLPITTLVLCDNAIEDLSILAGCQVVDLRLHTGQVSLEGAGELPRLRNLGLFSSKVTDLSPLAQADLLETFCFNGPAVPDFSPLAGLPRLNLVLVPQSMTAAAELACPGRVSPLG